MRAAALALLLLAAPAAAQQLYPPGWTPVYVADWGGLNVLLDSSDLGADAQVARNVLTDGGYLEKMPGNVLLTTILSGYGNKYVGDWAAPSGTRYLIAQASNTVYQTDFSGTPVALGTVTAGAQLTSVPAFNRVYFADGSKPLWYWDETSTGTVRDTASNVAAPNCTYIAEKDTRIFCANIPTEGTSRVRLSSAGGAGYYVVPADVGSVDNAPNVFDFTPDDGDRINCLAPTPWGMFVGKKYSSHMIKGTGNLTYDLRVIDPKVGCVDNRTVQMVNGVLQWLSVDGVYGYEGSGPPRILSRDLDPIMRGLNFADANSREWIVDIQSDWQSGAINDGGRTWDTVTVPGSLIMSSQTFVDTSSSNFVAGTLVRTSTETTDFVRLIVSTGLINQGDFEGSTNAWTCGTSGSSTCGVGQYGVVNNTFQARLEALDGSGCGDFYIRVNNGYNDAALANLTISNGSSGTNAVVDLVANLGGISTDTLRFCFQDAFPGSGAGCGAGSSRTNLYSTATTGGFTLMYDWANVCDGTNRRLYLDNVRLSSYPPTGTFTSRSFDTLVTTPTLNQFAVSFTSTSQATLTFQEQDSADNASWGTAVSLNPHARPTLQRRYWRYVGNFVGPRGGTLTARLADVGTITAIGTGTYRSDVHFIGTDISSWKQLNVTEANETGIAYHVRSANSVFTRNSSTPAWSYQLNNNTIGISTGAYYQFEIDSTSVTTTTQNYVAARVATNWEEGAPPPAVSGVNDRRYFVCVAVSTSASNPDTCFVRQKNNKWVTWEGPSVGAMGLYNNNLIVGDGSTDSKVWKIMQPGVYTYDGTAIDSEWVSADYTNGAAFNEKILREMWVDAEAVSGSSVTVAYNVNKSSAYVSRTIGLDNGRSINPDAYPIGYMQYGAINAWLPIAAGYDVGKYVRLKFTHAINSAYMRLNNYLIYLENKSRTVPAAPGNSTP